MLEPPDVEPSFAASTAMAASAVRGEIRQNAAIVAITIIQIDRFNCVLIFSCSLSVTRENFLSILYHFDTRDPLPVSYLV
jgi:hypothetical protein